ncbi:MAG: hypothetical protein HY812_03530 [Planctomycetes bacterium]|nr:hypothetical protein [Planctomycetota bacterium]
MAFGAVVVVFAWRVVYELEELRSAAEALCTESARAHSEVREGLSRVERAVDSLMGAEVVLPNRVLGKDDDDPAARGDSVAWSKDHDEIGGSSSAGAERAAVDPAEDVERSCAWTDFVPRELASVLVAHGLTPFDSGVDRALSEAARQWRDVVQAEEEARAAWNQRYGNVGASDPLWSERQEAQMNMELVGRRERKRILDAFDLSVGQVAARE